jgi:hypothetical protein
VSFVKIGAVTIIGYVATYIKVSSISYILLQICKKTNKPGKGNFHSNFVSDLSRVKIGAVKVILSGVSDFLFINY